MSNSDTESRIAPPEVETWLERTKDKFDSRRSSWERGVESILGLLFVGAVLLIVYWGGKEFSVWLSSGRQVRSERSCQQTPTPESLYEVLGTYQDKVYFFNQSTRKVYTYDVQTQDEMEAFALLPYEAFCWSPHGNKIVLISRHRNSLGSLYVVELDQSSPAPVLITERETGIDFPSNVVIQGDLPFAWNKGADYIAFVARNQTEGKDALFVIAAEGGKYYRLPEKERITSLAWASDKIVFVALERGRESRFVVDFDGGALSEIE